MGITFKDMVVFVLGILGSMIAGLLLTMVFDVDITNLKDSIATITIMIILAGVVLWIFQKKVDEVNVELEAREKGQNELENEIKRLENELSRANSLVDIKVENKYIKDRIFKLEERLGKNGG